MRDLRNVVDAFGILSGLISLGATFGWLGAVIGRYGFRRSVSVAEWVAHGAGALGVLGLVLAVAYLFLA